mmetsp:Transcript_81819/g.128862  ORF Transcript_81819/g.128862 Transcript_81819/m.128862 type:complete len:192 (+) Transcript_81819:88-663(+)
MVAMELRSDVQNARRSLLFQPDHIVWGRLDRKALSIALGTSDCQHTSEIALLESDDSSSDFSEDDGLLADHSWNFAVDQSSPDESSRQPSHTLHPRDDSKSEEKGDDFQDNYRMLGSIYRNGARPCRGQRIRHQKHIERLMRSISEFPEEFDCDRMDLPPSLANDRSAKKTLTAKLEAYRQHIIRKRQRQP